jgi:DNA-binding protein YbaB
MYTPIKLDKTRNLRYGFKAMRMLQNELKKLGTDLSEGEPSFEAVAIIVWVGLVHEDSTLTLDNVVDLLDAADDFVEVADIAMGALDEAYGDKKKKVAKKANR